MTSPIAGNPQSVSQPVSPTQAEAQSLSDDVNRASTSSGIQSTAAVVAHQQDNPQRQHSAPVPLFLANVDKLLEAAAYIERARVAEPLNAAGITTQQNLAKRKARTTTEASQDSAKLKKTKKKRLQSVTLPRTTIQQSVSSMPSMKLKQHMRLHEPKSPPSTRTNQQGGPQQVAPSVAKPFICSDCDKGFVNRSKLKEHLSVHTDERPFKCLQCDKSYKRRPALSAHKYIHRPQKTWPYHCDCGRPFMYREAFVVHKRSHTGELPYRCTLCSKGFSVKGNLTKHLRTHIRKKPYYCSFCEQTFGTSTQLVVHTRVHTNERPYPCTKCDMRFKTSTNLNRHQKKSCTAKT